MRWKLRILFFLFLLVPLHLAAREEGDYKDILLITSHSETSVWAEGMLVPVRQFVGARDDIRLSITYLQITSIESVEELEAKTQAALDSCSRKPDLVILLGGSAYQLAYQVNEKWSGVPMLLLGEIAYYCESQYTLYGQPDPNAQRTPVTEMRSKGLNLTYVHTPSMVEQTLDLMVSMRPQMNKLIFIAGENFRCKEQYLRLQRYMRDKYPSLAFAPVFSSDYSTDELIELLRAEKYPETGVLFSSWLAHDDYLETVASRNSIVQVLEFIAPLYTIYQYDLNKHQDIVGFYSYNPEYYQSIVTGRLENILDEDVHPRNIPPMSMDVGKPVLNWHALMLYYFDLNLLPQDAIIVGKPVTFWEQYKFTMLLVMFGLLLVLGLFVFLVMRRSVNALRKANAISEKGNRMKTAFVQNITHEIRTPLNAVIGFSQLLCLPDGYNSEEEQAEYLGYVLNNSQLLTVIVNDLLSLSDMENGQFHINKSPVNLNECARMAIKSVERDVPAGVQLIQKPGLPEEMRVNTDGFRVQQVLINFLSNACKYTEQGTITISSSMVENPGFVTFAVEDTGPGIPRNKAEEVFERFIKLDGSKQGAGLGLSICRIIATNLKGNVWVDTEYTGGARLVLTIPLNG